MGGCFPSQQLTPVASLYFSGLKMLQSLGILVVVDFYFVCVCVCVCARARVFSCACGMWKLPGQELNLRHSSDNARFLTHCTIRELPKVDFIHCLTQVNQSQSWFSWELPRTHNPQDSGADS